MRLYFHQFNVNLFQEWRFPLTVRPALFSFGLVNHSYSETKDTLLEYAWPLTHAFVFTAPDQFL